MRSVIWAAAIGVAVAAVFVRSAPGAATVAGPYFDQPQLRIEVGDHDGRINAMAVDEERHILVTASNDKTVRIWNLPVNGEGAPRLADVIHLPIGPGEIGAAWALALSPDAARIAVAGKLADGSGNGELLVFDRLSGRAVAHLVVPHSTPSLAFSRDGAFLAAGSLRGGGVKVWAVSNWASVAEDDDYGDDIAGVAFTADGRLVTACQDGGVRLYDTAFHLRAHVDLGVGIIPLQLAISQDGKHVAIGHSSDAGVTVFDIAGDSFANRRDFHAEGWRPGEGRQSGDWLGTTAWSGDGKYLFAAGLYSGPQQDTHPVVRFDVGTGAPAALFDALQVRGAIRALAPLGTNGVLVASDDPVLGSYKEDGSIGLRSVDAIHRAALPNDLIGVSPNGTVIALPGEFGQPPVRFDAVGTQIASPAADDASLLRDEHDAKAFKIGNWRASFSPTFSSTTEPQERTLKLGYWWNKVLSNRVHDYAVAPGEGWFVFASDYGLEVFSAKGERLSAVNLPASALKCEITPDGRFVVATFSDGIVRWFAVETTESPVGLDEVLDLYIHEPDRRWIAWGAKTGLYEASAGGEELLGWLVNRGPDHAALFYSSGRFRDLFYRPGIAEQILRAGKEPSAPGASTLLDRLPPVVHILGVDRSRPDSAVVRYIADSPSGRPVTDLHVFVDGARVDMKGARGLAAAGAEQSMTVSLPQGTGPKDLSISGGNNGQFGDAAGAKIPPSLAPSHGALTGKLYALVVGVKDYRDKTIPAADYSDDDAAAVGNALREQKGIMYADVDVHTLTNKQATRGNIVTELLRLAAKSTENDVSVLFMSGHATTWQDPETAKQLAGIYYFVPYDADFASGQLAGTGVSSGDIELFLSRARGKRFVFLDTCYSAEMEKIDMGGLVNLLGSSENSAVVWSSSNGKEESYPLPEQKHGVFTVALLKALHGSADNYVYSQDHRLTQRGLSSWFDMTVPVLSGDRQHPTAWGAGLSGEAESILGVVPP